MQERDSSAAPSAPVADAAEPVASGRPMEVRRAVRLFLVAMVIIMAGGFFGPQDQLGFATWIVLTALGTALWLWSLSQLSDGRNWARVFCVVLTAMGYSFHAAMLKGHPVFAVATVVSSALDLYALYLLFTEPANAWFRARTQPVR